MREAIKIYSIRTPAATCGQLLAADQCTLPARYCRLSDRGRNWRAPTMQQGLQKRAVETQAAEFLIVSDMQEAGSLEMTAQAIQPS